MINFLIPFTSIFIVLLLFLLSKKIPAIVESPSKTIRKIHNKSMIKVGGISFISFYILLVLIQNLEIKLLIIFSIFFLILGLIADLNKNFSAFNRFIALILLIICYFNISGEYISGLTNMLYINGIFNLNPFYPILFSLACILISTNSFNLIDGQHGLMLGTSLIILYSLKISIPENDLELEFTINSLMLISFTLMFFNFFTGRIKSGDCGSYFLGFSIGALAIYSNNQNYINSFYIACIISYPTFELFFTYVRRILNNKNPFMPDNLHLHSNIYKLLRTSEYFKDYKNGNLNRLTSLLILFVQTIIQINLFYYGNSSNYLLIFMLIFLTYLLSYFFVSIMLNKYSTKI